MYSSNEDRPLGASLDERLVDRLMRRDDDAWRWLLSEYDSHFRRALWSASSRVSGCRRLCAADVPALVDDLKVYFFVAFARSFRRFEGEAQFRSFLWRAALNFVLERRRSLPQEHEDDEDLAIEEISLSRWRTECCRSNVDARRRLSACVSCLPLQHRVVLVLYHYGEEPRSGATVAQIMGVSVDAAHKRHQRALSALRHSVGAWLELESVRSQREVASCAREHGRPSARPSHRGRDRNESRRSARRRRLCRSPVTAHE